MIIGASAPDVNCASGAPVVPVFRVPSRSTAAHAPTRPSPVAGWKPAPGLSPGTDRRRPEARNIVSRGIPRCYGATGTADSVEYVADQFSPKPLPHRIATESGSVSVTLPLTSARKSMVPFGYGAPS